MKNEKKWRALYFIFPLGTLLIYFSKEAVEEKIESTRITLLPLPSLMLRQSFDLFLWATIILISLFLLSFKYKKLNTPEATTIVAAGLLLLTLIVLWNSLIFIGFFT
jgi:hypothetical protein